jgi:hypothetical protein
MKTKIDLAVGSDDEGCIGVVAKGDNFEERLTELLEEHFSIVVSKLLIEFEEGREDRAMVTFQDEDGDASHYEVELQETWIY